MKRFNRTSLATAVGLAILGLAPVTAAKDFKWTTVVNNGFFVPACAQTDGTRLFNSYSQPSINEAGLVVFRGRSKGSDGGGGEGEEAAALAAPDAEVGAPARGVYSRNMGQKNAPINVVACVRSAVPDPNNLYGNTSDEVAGTFNEFPAFPRIDATSSSIATRGQSTPVWEYATFIDYATEPPTETTTKVGTSGVYVQVADELVTGGSLLGGVKDFESPDWDFPEFSVPGAPEGTKFDQFPGSPTIADETLVAYKGNFTVSGSGKTGVFFRDVSDELNPTYLVADSLSTLIPGTSQKFGSTAPPSAAGGYVFFIGSDNEDNPTQGGLYRAPMNTDRNPDVPADLTALVRVNLTGVPGETYNFAKLGEGLSITKDANLVAFWGTWGIETFAKTLYCPADGNAAIKAECLRQYPSGYAVVNIPVNQGIFVHNVDTGNTVAIAKTGMFGFSDFLYWVFSGAPPGVGGGHEGDEGTEDREPPRWRSSAFAAISLISSASYAVAFKGTQEGVPGIFLGDGSAAPLTLVKLGDDGKKIDPLAPALSKVTAIGIEREGLRGQNLAITASMLYEGIDPVTNEPVSIGWAGIYLTNTGKSLK